MENELQAQIDTLRGDLEALNAEYYTNNFSTSQDFQKYSRFNTRLRVPMFSSAPTLAEIGEVYANSTNGKLYICTSANTFSLVGGQV